MGTRRAPDRAGTGGVGPPATVMLFVPYVPEDTPEAPTPVAAGESSPWDVAIMELLTAEDPTQVVALEPLARTPGARPFPQGRQQWEQLCAAVLDVLAEYGVHQRLGGVMQSQPTRLTRADGRVTGPAADAQWALVVIGEVPMVRAEELDARLRALVHRVGIAPMWLSITPAVHSVIPARGRGGLRIVE